ncbi:MAG: hypothetical protein ACRDT0_19975 [Pseudonocardiaceae bacterium]
MTGDSTPELITVQARPVVVLARYRPGLDGEAAQTVHVVPHPGPVDSGAVSALCGALLACEQLEIVTPGDGMPCTVCLLIGSSSTPQPPVALPGESLPEVTGVPSEPGAAAGCYRAWGWPVTTRRDQVLLALDHDAVALLIPIDLATQVQPLLATRQCPAPVLAHPDAPQHRVFLAGEPFGAELPWPPGVQPVTGSLPLPPTVTPRGPVRWAHLPQAQPLTTCREIDLCSAVCTALRPSPVPRPPTVSGQERPS